MTEGAGRPAPGLLWLWRIRALLGALAVGAVGGIIALGVLRGALQLDRAAALPVAIAIAAALGLVAAVLGDWHARRAFAFCRWQHLPDAGIVAWSGAWWQREIRIPLVRLQHLDVVRGPLERRLGLASLELHTAGSHDHRTRLPGLDPEAANRLRDVLLEELQRVAIRTAGAPRDGEVA